MSVFAIMLMLQSRAAGHDDQALLLLACKQARMAWRLWSFFSAVLRARSETRGHQENLGGKLLLMLMLLLLLLLLLL